MFRFQFIMALVSLLAFPACFGKLKLQANNEDKTLNVIRATSTEEANLYLSVIPFGQRLNQIFVTEPADGTSSTRLVFAINNLGRSPATDLHVALSNSAY